MADFKDKFKGWIGQEPVPPAPPEPASILVQHRDDARKKLARLSEELTQSRKAMEQEFRKKSEERIRLFAQLAHSDAQAQAMLEQERTKFYRIQKEYEFELETLDAALKKENLLLQNTLQEQEQIKRINQNKYLQKIIFQDRDLMHFLTNITKLIQQA